MSPAAAVLAPAPGAARSTTTTDAPRCAARHAPARPIAPAPTTRTSELRSTPAAYEPGRRLRGLRAPVEDERRLRLVRQVHEVEDHLQRLLRADDVVAAVAELDVRELVPGAPRPIAVDQDVVEDHE